MARPYKVDNDRPALIKCDNCGRSFGERVRQKGHETEDGSIALQMDDARKVRALWLPPREESGYQLKGCTDKGRPGTTSGLTQYQ